MLQSIDLKNLANFRHWEGHQFEFQILGDSKSMKIQNGTGAHLSAAAAA
jgi:hypothetical protein